MFVSNLVHISSPVLNFPPGNGLLPCPPLYIHVLYNVLQLTSKQIAQIFKLLSAVFQRVSEAKLYFIQKEFHSGFPSIVKREKFSQLFSLTSYKLGARERPRMRTQLAWIARDCNTRMPCNVKMAALLVKWSIYVAASILHDEGLGREGEIAKYLKILKRNRFIFEKMLNSRRFIPVFVRRVRVLHTRRAFGRVSAAQLQRTIQKTFPRWGKVGCMSIFCWCLLHVFLFVCGVEALSRYVMHQGWGFKSHHVCLAAMVSMNVVQKFCTILYRLANKYDEINDWIIYLHVKCLYVHFV